MLCQHNKEKHRQTDRQKGNTPELRPGSRPPDPICSYRCWIRLNSREVAISPCKLVERAGNHSGHFCQGLQRKERALVLIKTGRPSARKAGQQGRRCTGCRCVSMATRHARQYKVAPPLPSQVFAKDRWKVSFPTSPPSASAHHLRRVRHVIQGCLGAHPLGVFH